MDKPIQQRNNRKLLIYGILFALFMFGFGFALVPLYDVFCNVLGINGKTNANPAAVYAGHVDKTRLIRVEFLAAMGSNIPFEFRPETKVIEIHPGENKLVYFFAHNQANEKVDVRAIPSVAPGHAAKYLKKTECFCFAEQHLNANQTVDMPLMFHLDEHLPKSIHTITLSYTMYKAHDNQNNSKPVGKIS
ncbi:MAG: cytochrome c oxidase assembly protein [Legionellales bacterium]|nr:cytochrome c oxidase assembly protein [Legionellales bacterium]